ncbi:hypothetical protein Tco_1258285 [Tanacetum coccineum]
MVELKSYNPAAYDWLIQILAQQWSKSHFSGRGKRNLLLNNICEVFNMQLVDGRDQPIITCMEYTYIVSYEFNRQIVLDEEYSIHYNVEWNGGSLYQVNGPWVDQCVVDMDRRSPTVLIPPIHKIQVGRPPKKRKKSAHELATPSQAACAKNGSSQVVGSSQQSAAPSQVVGAMNCSSQHSAAPSQVSQGLSQQSA